MVVLRTALILYAGVLVAALAVGLILILIRLRATVAALARTADALRAVRDRTAPLEPHLGKLSSEVGICHEAVSRARHRLTDAAEQVEGAAARAGLLERTSPEDPTPGRLRFDAG